MCVFVRSCVRACESVRVWVCRCLGRCVPLCLCGRVGVWGLSKSASAFSTTVRWFCAVVFNYLHTNIFGVTLSDPICLDLK